MVKASPGTVIHATLRPQDLIPAFLELLESLDSLQYRKTIDHIKELDPNVIGTACHASGYVPGVDISDDHPWWDSEDSAYFLNETLFEVLQDYAPEGHYFGAHIGDGSDFGFWPFEDDDNDNGE